MAIPKLHRYIIFESLRGTASAFLAVAVLVAVAMSFDFWRDGHSSQMLFLLGYSLPQIFAFALPISFFAGIVLAVGRIASDGEFTLIRSCGIGIGSFYLSLLFVGFIVSSVMLCVNDRIVPWGERQSRGMINETAFDSLKNISKHEMTRIAFSDLSITFFAVNPDGGQPVTIISTADGDSRLIYADDIRITFPPDGRFATAELIHGFISDQSDPNLPRTNFDTMSFDIPSPSTSRPEVFVDRHVLSIRGVLFEANRIASLAERAETQVEAKRLRNVSRRHNSHGHYLIATSLAPFFLVFVAIPLALLLGRGNKAIGVSSAVLFIFAVYYPLLLGGRQLAEIGVISYPLLALNLPNIGALVIGLALALFIKK